MNTKKKISILLMVLVVSALFALPVMAEDAAVANGFYGIGSADNVSIKAFAGDTEVQSTQKDVNADSKAEAWYENSDRLEVSYSAATEAGYYGAILVEGTGLPTVDDEILFIDQVTAGSEGIKFNVYPMLPEETTGMTFYISSSIDDEDLIKIPLGYAVGVGTETDEPAYIPGDVDGNGSVTRSDLLRLAKHFSGFVVQINEAAADVTRDGKVTRNDLLRLAKYFSGFDIELGN